MKKFKPTRLNKFLCKNRDNAFCFHFRFSFLCSFVTPCLQHRIWAKFAGRLSSG